MGALGSHLSGVFSTATQSSLPSPSPGQSSGSWSRVSPRLRLSQATAEKDEDKAFVGARARARLPTKLENCSRQAVRHTFLLAPMRQQTGSGRRAGRRREVGACLPLPGKGCEERRRRASCRPPTPQDGWRPLWIAAHVGGWVALVALVGHFYKQGSGVASPSGAVPTVAKGQVALAPRFCGILVASPQGLVPASSSPESLAPRQGRRCL